MDLRFDQNSALAYKSNSQIVRVLTEHWMAREAFCPSCGAQRLSAYPNNRPVADFFCSRCDEDYELKSKLGKFGPRINDGAYASMLERLRGDCVPNLFLLRYTKDRAEVEDLLIIPKQFFSESIIERRKPLPPTARRAGWVGCNINISDVPLAGRIFIVRDGEMIEKRSVLRTWSQSLFLRDTKIEQRGWTLDVWRCIERLNKREFKLADMYTFEHDLQARHQKNKHVRAKIRQQLQILRDAGLIVFEGKGRYAIVD